MNSNQSPFDLPWSLFIDLQGFSEIYESKAGKALSSLRILALGLYKIGKKKYNELFIYQMGDGFIITPLTSNEQHLLKPIAIAVSLMRLMLRHSATTSAAISHGSVADIQAIHDEDLRKNLTNGIATFGFGLMTIPQVMGAGIINPYKLSTTKISGPRLIIDRKLEPLCQNEKKYFIGEYQDHIELNWIQYESDILDDCLSKIDEPKLSENELKHLLQNYINTNKLPDNWVRSAELLISKSNHKT